MSDRKLDTDYSDNLISFGCFFHRPLIHFSHFFQDLLDSVQLHNPEQLMETNIALLTLLAYNYVLLTVDRYK